MGEVKAQAVGRHQRARLLDVWAQHLPQRGVQQVRAGMVPHGGPARLRIHHPSKSLPHRQPFLGANLVHNDAGERGVGGAHLGQRFAAVRIEQLTHVAHLPARFGVEGRVVEHHLDFRAGRHLVQRSLFGDQRDDVAVVRRDLLVAVKCRRLHLRQLLIDGVGDLLRHPLPGGLGPFALLFQFGFEFLVSISGYLPTMFLRQVTKEVRPQTESIVSEEHIVATDSEFRGRVGFETGFKPRAQSLHRRDD